MKDKTQVWLVAALTLAQDEIHHPGAARARRIDLPRMIATVLAEATKDQPLMAMVREEIMKLEPA